MKKTVICSFVVSAVFLGLSVNAIETKSSDYVIVPDAPAAVDEVKSDVEAVVPEVKKADKKAKKAAKSVTKKADEIKVEPQKTVEAPAVNVVVPEKVEKVKKSAEKTKSVTEGASEIVISPDEVKNGSKPVIEAAPVKAVKENKIVIPLHKESVTHPKASDFVVIPDLSPAKQTEKALQTVAVGSTAVDEATANFESITDLGKYVKIKKDGKYGIFDKNGNIILAPVFQRITLTEFEGQDVFLAKADGKSRYYYPTGKLIPEDELYSVEQNSTVIVKKEEIPQFIPVVNKDNDIVYTKTEPAEKIANEDFVYEIKEIPLVKVKNVKADVVAANRAPRPSNELKEEAPAAASEAENKDIFTLNNKSFYKVEKDGKIGISDTDGNVIVPAMFDSFEVKNPGKPFKTPVFVVKDNNAVSIFDLKGRLIAEQVYNKVNVYEKGKIYTYTKEGDQGVLRESGKVIGYFTNEGENTKYTSAKTSLMKPHKINSLILTILNM